MLSKRTLLENSLQVANLVQPLLYHSTFQTEYFLKWVTEHISDEQKTQLARLTESLINTLFKIKELPDARHIDNQHRWFLQLKKNINAQCDKVSDQLENCKIRFVDEVNPIILINAVNMLVKTVDLSDADGAVELIDGMLIEIYQNVSRTGLRDKAPALTDEIEIFREKTTELLQLRDKLIHHQLDIKTLHTYQLAIAQLYADDISYLTTFVKARNQLQVFLITNADRLIDLNHHLLSVIEELEFRDQPRFMKARQTLFSITTKQQKLYEKACAFYREKNYDEALPRFNKLAIGFNHPQSLLKIGEMLIAGQGTSVDTFYGCWYIQLAFIYSKSRHFRHVALLKLEDMYLNKMLDPIQLDDDNNDNNPRELFNEMFKTIKSEKDFLEKSFHFAETYVLLYDTELQREKVNYQLALLYYQQANTCYQEAKKYYEQHEGEFASDHKLMKEFDELHKTFEHHASREGIFEVKNSLRFLSS